MSNIKIIATDLDGTILNSEHEFSDYTKKVWQKVQSMGVHILPVTGRTCMGMLSSVPYEICEYSINTNGVHIFKNNGGVPQNIWDKSMKWEQARKAIYYVDEHFPDLSMHLYVGEELFTKRRTEHSEEYTRRSGIKFSEVKSWDELEGKAVPKIMVLADHEKLLPLKDQLSTWEDYHAVFSVITYLEIFSSVASKGMALLHIAEELGVSADEMLGVGDSFNDVSMLDVCGHAYVMCNANEKVAPHLPRTKFTNDEDGAARLIEELLGL